MTSTSSEMQEMLQTHAHELSYEKCISQTNLLYQEEKARQLRLSILLLEDDKDDLHAQLLQSDLRIDELEGQAEDVRYDYGTVSEEAERLRSDLRLKNREIENLRAELDSLQGVSMDSTKLLTEKLSLSRELATLKPEVEHLRSQAASCQTLLSEKLSLQRQLSAAQVELEMEKRATQRAITREEGKQEHDAKLEAQIDNLQSELAKERRDRQKAERESQKVITEFDGKKTILESRLDAFRTKLRMTKEQLKETQEELQAARATARAQPGTMANLESTRDIVRNSRKRSIAQLDTDATIGTPGLMPAAKKNKRVSTVPGEKSTFSITPFLNRTASMAPESPMHEHPTIEHDGIDEEKDVHKEPADLPTESPSVKPTKKATVREPKKIIPPKKPTALSDANTAKVKTRGVPVRKSKIAPALEKVQEEGNDENLPPSNTQPVSSAEPVSKPLKAKAAESNDRGSEEPTFIKKKRKLLGGGLGKTLFDDDEAEAPKGGERGLHGGARGLGAFGRSIGTVKLGARAGAGASTSAFGAFSPLKKDRKVAAV